MFRKHYTVKRQSVKCVLFLAVCVYFKGLHFKQVGVYNFNGICGYRSHGVETNGSFISKTGL
jgi:hypothetical protein